MPDQPPVESPWPRAERIALFVLSPIVVVTLVGTALLLVLPGVDHSIHADEKLLAMGIALLFAAIAVVFIARLIGSLEKGDSLSIESHWGGLGGGVGGWRMSGASVNLLCGVTFAALAIVALSNYAPKPAKTDEKTDTASTTTAPPKQPVKPPQTETIGTTSTTVTTIGTQTGTAPPAQATTT